MKVGFSFTGVSSKEIAEAKSFARQWIVLPLNENNRFDISFEIILVGSASRGMAVHDEKGHFDLDYQIRINGDPLPKANEIRSLFFQEFRDIGFPQTENSTTALTIRMKKRRFSFDFVIIAEGCKHDLILKRNVNPNSGNSNSYSWCKLRSRFSSFYDQFDSLNSQDQETIRKAVVESKIKEYQKPVEARRSGTEIFIGEVEHFYERTQR